MKQYDAFIQWLEQVPFYGHKDGTRNIARLMDDLTGGFSQAIAPIPVIHVAGTNGKGSCCAMLASVLQAAGYRVGLYTSPHLISYTERMQVNGKPISPTAFVRVGRIVRRALREMTARGENHPTFFEILTAMGFYWFLEQKTDVIVLETGVGGRLDATNIIDHPALCLITSISLDHTKVLGDTLEAIAGEKAGILRQGAPVVAAKNPPEVRRVLEAAAKNCGAPYHYGGDEENLKKAEQYPIPLKGSYQKENLAAVLEGVAVLREGKVLFISEAALTEGLSQTSWPGRMQEIDYHGCPVILDGAHNPAGASLLAGQMDQEGREAVLVFSALGKKDVEGILGPLRDARTVTKVIFTCIDGQDETARFVEIWEKRRDSASYEIVKDPKTALEKAAALAGGGAGRENSPCVYVAGSLYLIGEVLAFLQR